MTYGSGSGALGRLLGEGGWQNNAGWLSGLGSGGWLRQGLTGARQTMPAPVSGGTPSPTSPTSPEASPGASAATPSEASLRPWQQRQQQRADRQNRREQRAMYGPGPYPVQRDGSRQLAPIVPTNQGGY